MARAIYRVIVTGVRFESATHTRHKNLKDMEAAIVMFERPADTPDQAREAVESYLCAEDVIFEEMYVEVKA